MEIEVTWCKSCRQVVSVKPAPKRIDRYDGLCSSCKKKNGTEIKEKDENEDILTE